MRVIGYTRLSRATESSTSIERQQQAIEQTASARSWELVRIEEDADVSATRSRLDRPGLNRARADLAAGRADALLVWKLDRIARSVVDFGMLLDAGVQIISCTEPLDTTSSMGRAMAEILQVFAAMESRNIGMRVSSARRYLPTVGRFPGGNPPYGYRPAPHPSGTGSTLEPDDTEHRVLRKMIDMAFSGMTAYSIAAALTLEGAVTRYRKPWSASTVRHILPSPALRGQAKSAGAVVRDDHGLPVAVYPPLVTAEEHARLVALFSTKRPVVAGTPRKAARMLSGLVFCGSCNTRMQLDRTVQRGDRYRCVARFQGIRCPAGATVKAERAEEHVQSEFLAVFGRYPVVQRVVQRTEHADFTAVEAAIRETTDALRDLDADVPGLVARLTALRTERDRLHDLPDEPRVLMLPTNETYGELWARSDFRARRQALADAGLTVTVQPDPTRHSPLADRLELHFEAPEVTSPSEL